MVLVCEGWIGGGHYIEPLLKRQGGVALRGQLGPPLHCREGAPETENQKDTWSRSHVTVIAKAILTPSALFTKN